MKSIFGNIVRQIMRSGRSKEVGVAHLFELLTKEVRVFLFSKVVAVPYKASYR